MEGRSCLGVTFVDSEISGLADGSGAFHVDVARRIIDVGGVQENQAGEYGGRELMECRAMPKQMVR
jgi:hypothetical protein